MLANCKADKLVVYAQPHRGTYLADALTKPCALAIQTDIVHVHDRVDTIESFASGRIYRFVDRNSGTSDRRLRLSQCAVDSAEEAGVEPTRRDTRLDGFEGRAPRRGRCSSVFEPTTHCHRAVPLGIADRRATAAEP